MIFMQTSFLFLVWKWRMHWAICSCALCISYPFSTSWITSNLMASFNQISLNFAETCLGDFSLFFHTLHCESPLLSGWEPGVIPACSQEAQSASRACLLSAGAVRWQQGAEGAEITVLGSGVWECGDKEVHRKPGVFCCSWNNLFFLNLPCSPKAAQ